MADGTPVCFRCKRTPDEIGEYRLLGKDAGLTAQEYVRRHEGTYNDRAGTFACTECYIAIGLPSAPAPGWKAPPL